VSLSLARALCNHLFFCLRPCLQNQKTKTRGIPNPPPHKKGKTKRGNFFSAKHRRPDSPKQKNKAKKTPNTNKRSRDFWQLQYPVQRIRSIRRRNLPMSKKKKKTNQNKQTKLAYLLALPTKARILCLDSL
jgi:hypothetical protein